LPVCKKERQVYQCQFPSIQSPLQGHNKQQRVKAALVRGQMLGGRRDQERRPA
jgi:hypothetical protein